MTGRERFRYLGLIALVTLVTMSAYEWLKQLMVPDISIWESHLVTVLFSTVVATTTGFVGLHLYARLQRRLIERTAEQSQVEAARRESEDRYRDLIENSRDLVCTHDLEGRILSVNPAPARALGYEASELVNTNLRAILAPATREQFTDYLRIIRRDGVAQGLMTVCTVAGERRVWEYTNTLRTDGVATPIVRGMAHDVTERKRAEEERAALLEIATEINRTANFADMLDHVQRRTAAILPCDRVVTYCWDSERSVYRAIAWYGVPPDLAADVAAGEFHPGEKIVDGLISGETVVINDIANQDWLPSELLPHFRLTAMALVPLAVHGRGLGGVGAVNGESGRPFSPHQVRLLELIAQQLGLAMEAHEVHRAQQDEAAVAAAVAQAGQQLISSLDTTWLVDRLCAMTTEVLGCDVSFTLMWQPSRNAYKCVAARGGEAAELEIIRALELPPEVVAGLTMALNHDGVAQVAMAAPPTRWAAMPARFGITVALYVPLRRAEAIIGIHAAGYRTHQGPFSKRQERMAVGIAQIASLALENVRLVEELERANRLKSDFMATMSHELRTPLNIITGYNDLLLSDRFGLLTPEQADTVQRTQRSAWDLLDLINATLNVGRLEVGRSPLDVHEIDLLALLRDLDAETASPRENTTVTLAWELPATLPHRLRTDPVKLKLVLKNLLANALKFTDQGRVTVGACPNHDGIEIFVADTGIGIAAEARASIFEPFEQVERGPARRFGGVGLGLYIARQLLTLLGGTIRVESELGCGSTFRVWLPWSIQGEASHPGSVDP